MSNIIKGLNLAISEPMVINPRFKPLIESAPAVAAQEEDIELTDIQGDVKSILEEAEGMVRELLDRAREEARNIVLDAREEAEVALAAAKLEAANIRAQAQKEGFEQGLRDAQKESEADRQAALEQCQEILEEARRTKIKIMESSTADTVRIAMAVAKKIIATEVLTNPNIITNVIREAIGFLDQASNIHVYVNPNEIEKVLADVADNQLNEIGQKELKNELVPDKRVAVGGCVVESDSGIVDARLETRIEKVEQALQDVIADDSAENF